MSLYDLIMEYPNADKYIQIPCYEVLVNKPNWKFGEYSKDFFSYGKKLMSSLKKWKLKYFDVSEDQKEVYFQIF